MLDLYLFEIQCAEEIGAYRIADELDQKLLKMASTDPKSIKKKIQKKFSQNSQIKNVDFSHSQGKFIISASSGMPFKTRREIESIASPYKVSFRYAQSLNNLMGPSPSGEDITLDRMQKEFPDDYIGPFEEEREPTEEELRFTSEFPADETEGDFDGLILQEAIADLRKRGIL